MRSDYVAIQQNRSLSDKDKIMDTTNRFFRLKLESRVQGRPLGFEFLFSLPAGGETWQFEWGRLRHTLFGIVIIPSR